MAEFKLLFLKMASLMARHYGKLWQIMTNYDKLCRKKILNWVKKTTWKLSGISNFAPIKDVEWDKKWTWISGADLEKIGVKRDSILEVTIKIAIIKSFITFKSFEIEPKLSTCIIKSIEGFLQLPFNPLLIDIRRWFNKHISQEPYSEGK